MLCPTFLPGLWLTWQLTFSYLTQLFCIFTSSAFFFLNINWLIICDNCLSIPGSTFSYICIFRNSAKHILSAGMAPLAEKCCWRFVVGGATLALRCHFSESEKTFCSLNCSSLMVLAVIDQVFHPGYFSAVTLSQTASIRISKVPCFHFSQALALFRPLNLSTCWLPQQSEFCLHRHNSCYSVSLL